ncbi:MAG TPA: helix-turn-helix transcriptional regulator [Terriglobales bacterium]|jgi:transcriptional regulator with XRE-family HTH domain|nr:helix-turn-helix transcriptional regulator [Terriglobales bacterium]
MTPIAGESSALTIALRRSFKDEEYRYGYVESFLDAFIAAQIRALRLQRGWEQFDLASRMQTTQSGISRLEDVNYSSWSLKTLKRLAKVFGLRLKVSFEEFATLPEDIDNFRPIALERTPFENDCILGPMASLWVFNSYNDELNIQDTSQGISQSLVNPDEDFQKRKPPQSQQIEAKGAECAAIGHYAR